jgi:hypothetical protein
MGKPKGVSISKCMNFHTKEIEMSDGIERQKQVDEVFCSSCGAIIKMDMIP